jgi:hypothetical protein
MITWHRLAELPIWVNCWAYCSGTTIYRDILLSNIWTIGILQN